MSSQQVQSTLNQINTTLKGLTDGPYSKYSCKTVSWDDVQRGTVGGSSNVSCWGSNITDTRLYAKDGRQLFTVRGDNWNERLGKVSSNELALVASSPSNLLSDGSNSSRTSSDTPIRPFTLLEILSRSSEFGKYAGLTTENLSDETLDKEVSVRFQTTFLPVDEGEKTSLEFAPEAYNYNTRSDDDPRNLVLLCTSQGLAVQQDGSGSKKLYHHAVGDDGSTVNRYWLEAESSNHKVGGSQVETKEEKEDAIKRGKATSSVIGVKGIGTRFNVLMTIQIPLQQKPTPRIMYKTLYSEEDCDEECEEESLSDEGFLLCSVPMASTLCSLPAPPPSGAKKKAKKRKSTPITFGKSSAARVSRGSFVDTWTGLTVKEPKRHENEHITATIVLYYTCAGGVPTEQDVKAAIDDLEDLYQSVEANGHLSDEKFNFMKSELTVKNVVDIETKLATQPPPPKVPAPFHFDVFPS